MFRRIEITANDGYESLIVGSGEAGQYLAWTVAQSGRRTVVVERKVIGGSCPNIGCLPRNNFIHSAKVASLAARADEFGLEGAPHRTSMAGVLHRKQAMIDALVRPPRNVSGQRCRTDHGQSPFDA